MSTPDLPVPLLRAWFLSTLRMLKVWGIGLAYGSGYALALAGTEWARGAKLSGLLIDDHPYESLIMVMACGYVIGRKAGRKSA